MDKRKETIQEKVQILEKIIKYFESDDIDLDQAIEKYEEANKLVKGINEVLKEYELRITKIKQAEWPFLETLFKQIA